jgi:tripartite-type tricarboxylate transporter receptor subunit TctC
MNRFEAFAATRPDRLRHGLLSLALAVAVAGAIVPVAIAQGFPSQPVTMIVPWPPGGGSDIAMRLVADAASKRMGVPVVVVNRPGAGGTIGLKEMASSKPDGYTIAMVATGAVFAQYNNPNANALSDFEPVVFFGDDPVVLSVGAKTSIRTLADYIAAAKANPGKLRNGNDQPGGSSHVAASLMERTLATKINKISYAGFAPTVQALLSGEIDSATVPAPDISQHHKSGAARSLAIAGTQRHFLLPDVPTFREQGIDFVAGTWRFIAAPRGTPADRLATLETRLLETLRDKGFIEKARAAGFIVEPMNRADTSRRVAAEDAAMYPVFLEAGLVRARQK